MLYCLQYECFYTWEKLNIQLTLMLNRMNRIKKQMSKSPLLHNNISFWNLFKHYICSLITPCCSVVMTTPASYFTLIVNILPSNESTTPPPLAVMYFPWNQFRNRVIWVIIHPNILIIIKRSSLLIFLLVAQC